MADTFAEGWNLARVAQILANSAWDDSSGSSFRKYTDKYRLEIKEKKDYILLSSLDDKLIARVEGDIAKRIPEYQLAGRIARRSVLHIGTTGSYVEGWDFEKTAILVSTNSWKTIYPGEKLDSMCSYYSYGKYRLRIPKTSYSDTILSETYDPIAICGSYDIARVNPSVSDLLTTYKNGGKNLTEKEVAKHHERYEKRNAPEVKLFQGLVFTFIVCAGALFFGTIHISQIISPPLNESIQPYAE